MAMIAGWTVLIALVVFGANMAGLNPDADPTPNWARLVGVGVLLLAVGTFIVI